MDSKVFDRLAVQEAEHWWFRARRSVLKRLIQLYRPGDGPLRILEAGCGTGGNLHMLSEFGEVSAFELDTHACHTAREKGFLVKQGALPDSHPYAGESFDLIVVFDVLEHVREDQSSLEALRKLLRPGGVIILTVPAFPFLWSAHDELHHHHRRYRRPGLRSQFQRAGFEVRKISYYNFWLFPLVVPVRLLKKLSGSQGSDEEVLPSPPVNRLLENIFASERFLLPHMDFPFGISLLVVAS